MPLISVIVPVYKTEEWLPLCVNSILAQSFRDFELILVDDGSPDGSGKLCDDLASRDDRIRVLHKENGGLSDARNAGVKKAQGMYVTFIDSDDFVEPCYLNALLTALRQTDAQLAVARFDKVPPQKQGCWGDKQSGSEHICVERWGCTQANAEMAWGKKNSMIAWNKLAPRKLYIKYPFEKGKLHEDLRHTYLLLHECEVVGFADVVTYHYVMHGGSITTRKVVPEKQCRDYAEAIQLCTQNMRSWYPELNSAIDSLQAREYMSVYLMSCRAPVQTEYTRSLRKEIRGWFKKNGMSAVREKGALGNVRARALLMTISPELYRITYSIGIHFTGKSFK